MDDNPFHAPKSFSPRKQRWRDRPIYWSWPLFGIVSGLFISFTLTLAMGTVDRLTSVEAIYAQHSVIVTRIYVVSVLTLVAVSYPIGKISMERLAEVTVVVITLSILANMLLPALASN